MKDLPEYSYEEFTSNSGILKYRQLRPERFDPDNRYPLVIVLHGAGERGSNNKTQLRNGGSLFLGGSRTRNPAVVIFPQVPKGEFWSAVDADRSTRPFTFTFPQEPVITKPMKKLLELIDEKTALDYIDKSRIYIIGMSMGGMGTYELLAKYPERFAAAIAICGATSDTSASRIGAGNAVWAFHGAEDSIIDVDHSINASELITKAGGKSKLTIYPDAGHSSWNQAFKEPELLNWLYSHTRPAQPN